MRNPVPVLSLVVYMALRSSSIMPPEEANEPADAFLWAPAYPGWYDFALVASLCAGIAFGSVRVARGTLVMLYVLLLVVLTSLLSGYRLGPDFVVSALVYYARFAAAFTLAAWLTYRSGVESAESVVLLLFLVLAAMAVLVYSLNLGSFNRIYASAMTVASFSQITAVSCFLALLRRRRVMTMVTGTFLLLTFSRTSILAFGLLVTVYLFHSREVPLSTKAVQIACIALLLSIGGLGLVRYGGPEFQGVVERAFDWHEISTLNGRSEIWSHALQLVTSGRVPLTGVGYNAASSLLATNDFLLTGEDGQTTHAAHFHSILFEYGFGLGVVSIVIFAGLARRIVETFRHRIYPAFFIFAFFAITQGIDFTFYRPKEVIMWSLLLGIADCQWRMKRRGSAGVTVRAHQHHAAAPQSVPA